MADDVYKCSITEMPIDFFYSDDFKDLLKYSKSYNDEAEIWLDPDNKKDVIGGYRIVEVDYLNKKGFIAMPIRVAWDGGFYVTSIDPDNSVRVIMSMDAFVDIACKALGIKTAPEVLTEFAINLVKNADADEEIRPYYNFYAIDLLDAVDNIGIVDILMAIDDDFTRVVNQKVMTFFYYALYEFFGEEMTGTEVSNPWSFRKIDLPEGQSTIEPDSSGIIESLFSQLLDQNVADYDTLMNLYENIDQSDEDLQTVLANHVVKIGYSTWNNTLVIAGFHTNGNVVTSYESDGSQKYQIYFDVVQSIRYNISNGAKLDTGINQTGTSGSYYSEYCYNYMRSNFLNNYYLIYNSHWSQGATYNWISTLGVSSAYKGYTVIGDTPTGAGLDADYPDWGDDNYPLGDPDPDDPDSQTYIWQGIPMPGRRVNMPIIPGLPPAKPTNIINSTPTIPDDDPVQGTNGLINVYELTNSDLLQFNNWMWTKDIWTNIKEMFVNNPMECIIGLHDIYIDPINRESYTENIKLGYLTCDTVAVPVIEDRYQTFSYSAVHISPYFDDVRDWDTKVTIFLPFIGFKELDINEVLDQYIEVIYAVDCWSGDLLCTLNVKSVLTTDDYKTLYQFEGNCASQLPITGSDRSGLYKKAASVATSAVSAVATGNIGGLVESGINAVITPNSRIEKGGSIAGNTGAMAFKKPYIIIERPVPADAVDREKYIGYPANYSLQISSVTGYSEWDGVRVDTISRATDKEKSEILTLLKSGVVL